jgi:hypothetical protein
MHALVVALPARAQVGKARRDGQHGQKPIEDLFQVDLVDAPYRAIQQMGAVVGSVHLRSTIKVSVAWATRDQ